MWKGYISEVLVDRYCSGVIDSGGLANDALGPVPEGFCWYVERETFWSNTSSATNAVCEVFAQRSQNPPAATGQDKQGREDVAVGTEVKNGAHDNAAPIYLGPGYFLVVSWSGLTQNDLVAFSSQIRVHRLEATIEPLRGGHGLEELPMGEHIAHAVIPGDEIAEI